jgi:hypothetical protein
MLARKLLFVSNPKKRIHILPSLIEVAVSLWRVVATAAHGAVTNLDA